MAYQLFLIHMKKRNDLQYGNYPKNSNKLPLMMLYIQLYIIYRSNLCNEFLLLTSLPREKMNPSKVHINSVNILIIILVKMNILMRIKYVIIEYCPVNQHLHVQ